MLKLTEFSTIILCYPHRVEASIFNNLLELKPKDAELQRLHAP